MGLVAGLAQRAVDDLETDYRTMGRDRWGRQRTPGVRANGEVNPNAYSPGLRVTDPAFRSNSLADVSSQYGYTPAALDMSGTDPSKTLGQIAQAGQDIKKNLYQPLEQTLIDSLDDNTLVKEARENVQSSLGSSLERAKRQASRYGGITDPLQMAELQRKTGLMEAVTGVGEVNEARLDQNQRNTQVRQGLINYFRGVQGAGMSGLSDAAGMQTNRENQGAMARAQSRAQKTQIAGSLASAAIFAMLTL